ncbi:MAG: helix-turn-helix domain-containing protein [Mucilaginibacter sp.]|nr:helix-turn-helix domain-containing protein [Mucilaginibacter sp.]
MKPNLIKSDSEAEASFSFRIDHLPTINSKWHYHQEFELIYFKKGNGTQFIGDSITNFSNGDIMLIGPHLEHYWRFKEKYFLTDDSKPVEVYVIHFQQNFCGSAFFNLPECYEVFKLLESSKQGIKVGNANNQVAECITQMANARSYERLSLLIKALGLIAYDETAQSMVTSGLKNPLVFDDKRINQIIDYISKNLQKNISLNDLSDVAAMNPTSLCRYFKARMNENLSSFIWKMRIGYACKLIQKEEMSMKQIAHESGFGNLTSFHRAFKKLKGTTPLMFQQKISS